MSWFCRAPATAKATVNNPSNYLRILQQRWRVVAVCLFVGIIAGLISTSGGGGSAGTGGRQYSSTATLTSSNLDSGGTARDLARAAKLITTQTVATQAVKAAKISGDPMTVANSIAVEPDVEGGVLTITAENSSPTAAKTLAAAFGEAVIQGLQRANDLAVQKLNAQIASVEDQLNPAEGSPVPNRAELQASEKAMKAKVAALQSANAGPPLVVLDTSSAELTSSPPGRFTAPSGLGPRLLVGLFLGLVLGVALALLLDRVDTRLRTRSAVQDAFRLPVIGEIPQLSKRDRRGDHVVAAEHPDSAAAESYRSLRSAVLNLPSTRLVGRRGAINPADEQHSDPPAVVLVTSPRRGDGKTTTVVNLAACMAETGRTVLVLDCDLRNPAVHRYLKASRPEGLSNLLVVGVDRDTELVLQDSWIVDRDLERAVQDTPIPGVSVATAGTAVHHPAALLSKMASIIGAARRYADVVIIDAPPLLTANDAIEIVPYVDTVLVVSRAGATTAEHAERASDALGRIQAPVTGVALTAAGRQFAGADRDGDVGTNWKRFTDWLTTGGEQSRGRDWPADMDEATHARLERDLVPGMHRAERSAAPDRLPRAVPPDPEQTQEIRRPGDAHLPNGDRRGSLGQQPDDGLDRR
jgi:capsular exopolysaccharide synthesis family protein